MPTERTLGKPELIKKQIPDQIVASLLSGLENRLVAVVLFGSRARGDASPDSDWDLLVIAEELPPHAMERYAFLKSLLPADFRSQVSMLAKTPEEFEARLPALYLDIALDGQILFDPKGYAAHRLDTLNRIITKAGLYRDRTAAGDSWPWRDPPRAAQWSLEWDSSEMNPVEDARYRLRLAEGFLNEARQDIELGRWRSCVDNSQLAVENSANAPLAQLGPVGRTHAPAASLRQALSAGQFHSDISKSVERLAELADMLGWDVHMGSDYGDETAGLTPWDLFDETFARKALAQAEEAVTLAREVERDKPT